MLWFCVVNHWVGYDRGSVEILGSWSSLLKCWGMNLICSNCVFDYSSLHMCFYVFESTVYMV
jgi:hypothetical protein